VIFWDSSAIVSLLVAEPRSEEVREIVRADGHMIVWWGTVVECLSAIARNERDRVLTAAGGDQARRRLAVLRDDWDEVFPVEEVRDRAGSLLRRHEVKAGDTFQLAAALTWATGRPRTHMFLTLDKGLATAARGEGFELVRPAEMDP
jgi:predicted nucleic acid-binding protein